MQILNIPVLNWFYKRKKWGEELSYLESLTILSVNWL